jgi:lysozyme family protein
MAPTPEQTAAGYRNLWAKAVVKPAKRADAEAIARKMLAVRARYAAIETTCGVPWFMAAVIHMREASMNFAGVLHNGEKIIGTGRKTRLVPAGRGPFATWDEAALDALTMAPHALHRIVNWSLERMLYEIEKYNGFGYLGKCNSPYLWSWTSEYGGGKYVADHVFSRTAVDPQPGCVALLKALAALDADVAARLDGKVVALPVQPGATPRRKIPPPPPPSPRPPDIPAPKPAPAKPARSGGFFAALAAILKTLRRK